MSTNKKAGNLHRAVEEPLNCCKSDIACGIAGRVFATDEAGSKDKARAGKEPCVGPGFVFTGCTALEKEEMEWKSLEG